MTANSPGRNHPWRMKAKPVVPDVTGMKFTAPRKPSMTSVIRMGLRSIAATHTPRDKNERRALQWINETCDHAVRVKVKEKINAKR
jgi:hypothetical protein